MIKPRWNISHIQFSVLFTTSLYVVSNFINIDKIAKWFRVGETFDYSALIAFLILGFSLFFSIFLFFAHRWTIKPVAIIFIVLSAVVTYFISKYNVAIDRTMLMNAMHTDLIEVRSLLTVRMMPYLLFLIVIPVLLVIFTKITFHHPAKYLATSFALIFMSLSMGIGLLYLEFPSIHRAGNMSNKYILNSLVPVNYLNGFASALLRTTAPYFQNKTGETEITGHISASEDLLVILVIGESARQKSFSLYGYERRQTNPLLSKHNDLHTLNGRAKIGTTLLALPEILQKDGTNLTSITSKVGVETYCYVNFKLYDNCDAVGEVHPSNCGHDGRCFDEDVVPLLRENLSTYQSGYRFVVMHLGGGSHGPVYKDRHPPEFQIFKPQCLDADVINQCTIEELYNSYDNTILYTDYVLNQTIDVLDENGKPYVFIYVSDHGESLLENNLIFHGMPPGIPLPPEQAEIPLIVKSSIPISIIKRAEYSQNDIFDTVLGLLSIETNYLNKERIFIRN